MTGEQVADLHVHTTASDGTLTPSETVQEAARAGVSAVAITDHDTLEGVPEALEAGRRAGVVVVPGVEINTDYGQSEVHMLGYFINAESGPLSGELERLRVHRTERARAMVEKLRAIGIMITFDMVREIAGSGSVGRPHVARAIVQAGYSSNVSGAFGKYLVRGAAGYVPRSKLTPFAAIQIIRASGGVAVMAHPGSSKHDELIPQFAEAGMQGLEVYHTDHSSHERRHYKKLAVKYGLIITGGSDSHGPGVLKMVPIGHATVPLEAVDRLKEAAGIK
ncbi:MAG: PHP domain-containing protein [Armatimonadota bacterium]|mgnify:CR=1 FL=1|jgi:predicted metal-dependent phosphoesterase TrpH